MPRQLDDEERRHMWRLFEESAALIARAPYRDPEERRQLEARAESLALAAQKLQAVEFDGPIMIFDEKGLTFAGKQEGYR